MTTEQEWRSKVEGRAICARCGWRKADHGFGARLLGAVSCKRFEQHKVPRAGGGSERSRQSAFDVRGVGEGSGTPATVTEQLEEAS